MLFIQCALNTQSFVLTLEISSNDVSHLNVWQMKCYIYTQVKIIISQGGCFNFTIWQWNNHWRYLVVTFKITGYVHVTSNLLFMYSNQQLQHQTTQNSILQEMAWVWHLWSCLKIWISVNLILSCLGHISPHNNKRKIIFSLKIILMNILCMNTVYTHN